MRSRVRELLILSSIFTTVGMLWWSQQPDPGYFQRSFTARIYEQASTGTLALDLAHSSPGTAPFLVLLSEITGLSMFEVMYVPLAAIGQGLLYVGILWVLTRSLWYSGVFGVTMSLYPWAGYSSRTIHVHALGTVIFLTAVLLSAIVVTRNRSRTTGRDTLAFLILAISLLFIDYRMVIWALLLFAILGALSLRRDANFRPLLVAMLIGIGYWLKVTPYQYVGFLGTRLSNPLDPILNYFSASSTTQPFEYRAVSDGLSTSQLFFYLLFLICIVYGLYRTYETISTRKIRLDNAEILLGVVALAGGVSTAFYLLLGRFSQSFLIIGFPLIAAVALYRVPIRSIQFKQAMRVCGCGLLIVLVVGSFAIGMTTNTLDRTSDSPARQVGTHLYSTSDDPTILTDLTTAGRLEQQAAIYGADTNYQYYNVERYRSVTSGGSVDVDYVVIDYGAQNGVDSLGWDTFQNLAEHREAIHSNTNMRQIYDTENMSVYHRQQG